jgi:hypothetical protein
MASETGFMIASPSVADAERSDAKRIEAMGGTLIRPSCRFFIYPTALDAFQLKHAGRDDLRLYRVRPDNPAKAGQFNGFVATEAVFVVSEEPISLLTGTVRRSNTIMTIINGQLHSTDDRPSMTVTDAEGRPVEATWHQNNRVHRDGDQPARESYEDGLMWSQEWFLNGKPSRPDDKPAKINYHEGSVMKVSARLWYVDGLPRRLNADDPTRVVYYDTGAVSCEMWDVDACGHLARVISYGTDGAVVYDSSQASCNST